MFDLFSTRELASAIILILFSITALCNQGVRIALWRVIKSFCKPKLLTPLIIMVIYGVAIIYFVQMMPFWDWKYLKDILIWFIFVGVTMCYKAINIKYEQHFFRNILIDNLKFIILVEFFISSFTFHLVVELAMQIFLGFIVLMQVYTKKEAKYKQVHTLFIFLNTSSVIIIFVCTIKTALNEYTDIRIMSSIISLVTPLILTLLYLPVSYLMTLWAKYDRIFMRMSFKEPKIKMIRFKNRIAVMWVCKLSFKKLTLFDRHAIQGIYMRYDTPPFKEVLKNFRGKVHEYNID